MAGAGGVRAGRAFVELGIKDNLAAGLNAASKRLKAFGAGIAGVGAGLLGAGAALGAPLAAAVGTFTSFGDELSKMSQRTGISVEALSELRHAAEQSAVSAELLETGIKGMQKQITAAAGGNKAAGKAFTDLGVNVKELAKMTPENQFMALSEAVSRIKDPTKKAAMAMKVFGKSGQGMLPMLMDGAKGVQALRDEAKRLGLTVSTDAANSAVKLGDDLANLSASLKAAAFAVGAALAPMLIKIVGVIQDVATRIVFFVQNNQALVMTVASVAAGLVAAGVALITLGGLFTAAGMAIGALVTIGGAVMAVFSAIGAAIAFVLSPLGLIIAGVVAAGAAFLHFSGIGGQVVEFLVGSFTSLKDIFSATWQGIVDAISVGDLGLAARIAWTGVKLAFLEGIAPLRAMWTDFQTSMATAWNMTVAGIKNTWIDFQSIFLNAWSSTVAALKNTWAEIMGWFEKGITLWDKFVGNISPEEAEAKFKAIEDATNATQAGNTAAATAANQAVNQDAAAKKVANVAAAATVSGADVLAGEAEKEKLVKELAALKDQLNTQTKSAGLLAGAAKMESVAKEFDMSKIAPALTAPAANRNTPSAGAFSAAAAGRIGQKASIESRILSVAESQLEETQKSNQLLEDLGGAFV